MWNFVEIPIFLMEWHVPLTVSTHLHRVLILWTLHKGRIIFYSVETWVWLRINNAVNISNSEAKQNKIVW